MAAQAMMSTGFCSDLESWSRDVANFFQWVRWRIASVEVRRLTADRVASAVRKWKAVTGDLETLAHEIAQFSTGGKVETGAIVLVRREAGGGVIDARAIPRPRLVPSAGSRVVSSYESTGRAQSLKAFAQTRQLT